MATRNFVPRSGSEGQIGTTVKPWDKVIAITSSFSIHSGSITGNELTLISGSISSTGSFGRLEIAGNSSIGGDLDLTGNITIGDADTDSLTINADLTSNLIPDTDSTFNIGSITKNWKIGHIEQVSSTNITASSDISSSGNIFGTNLLADSSSVSTRLTAITSSISALKTNSGSFSTRITNLKADSGSFSTRVTNLKADSGSFSTRVTRNEGTGSKVLAGELEFTHITASGNISASGDIRSDGRIFEQDTSVIDHATAMAIVFGG